MQVDWNLLNHGRRWRASGAPSTVKGFTCVRLRTKASSSDSAVLESSLASILWVVGPAGIAPMALWNGMLVFKLGGADVGVCQGCCIGVADVVIPIPRIEAPLIGLAASLSRVQPAPVMGTRILAVRACGTPSCCAAENPGFETPANFFSCSRRTSHRSL